MRALDVRQNCGVFLYALLRGGRILLQNAFLSLGQVFGKDFVFWSVLSAYHHAMRLTKLLVSITTEFHCVCVDANRKDDEAVPKFLQLDTRGNICCYFTVNRILHFSLSCVSCLNDQKPHFHCCLQWRIYVLM